MHFCFIALPCLCASVASRNRLPARMLRLPERFVAAIRSLCKSYFCDKAAALVACGTSLSSSSRYGWLMYIIVQRLTSRPL
jgi:hypothetical protein